MSKPEEMQNENGEFDSLLVEQLEWERKWWRRISLFLYALLFTAVLLVMAYWR